MAEVTVRDAQRGDSTAIAEIWAAAIPYLVRSSARAAADLRADHALQRRRWVGLVDGTVAGEATAQQVMGEVFVTVEVHPDWGSRGLGTALLHTAITSFSGITMLRSVSTEDPIALAFAVRNGFLPEGEHVMACVVPGTVARVDDEPPGLRATTLDALPELKMLLSTHNLAAADDPSGLSRRLTMYELRAHWWDSPDNAPDLSFGLIADESSGPVLAAFSSVQVDRAQGRAWSSMTATHPSYRKRGLADWVKRRMLNSLAEAGITEAWTADNAENAAMTAVNTSLGYRRAARSIRLSRRLPVPTGAA